MRTSLRSTRGLNALAAPLAVPGGAFSGPLHLIDTEIVTKSSAWPFAPGGLRFRPRLASGGRRIGPQEFGSSTAKGGSRRPGWKFIRGS
jgi:hypothetical protein